MRQSDAPMVIVTVNFEGSPITGQQIGTLVRRVISDHAGCHFRDFRRYYDGYVTKYGQAAGDLMHSVDIIATLDEPYFRPEQTYRTILVTSHDWNTKEGMLPVLDRFVAIVKSFADELKDVYEAAVRAGELPCIGDLSDSANPAA